MNIAEPKIDAADNTKSHEHGEAILLRAHERLEVAPVTPEEPLYAVDKKGARWLGMAPSVAGGFVLVETGRADALSRWLDDQLYDHTTGFSDRVYLSTHQADEDDPVVDRAAAISAIRKDLHRVSNWQPWIAESCEETIDSFIGMLDLLEGVDERS